MKHYIIVKYNEKAGDKIILHKEIASLFQRAGNLPGIHSIELFDSVIDLPNRYDLMIVMTMEPEALEVFDHSDLHRLWKEEYSQYLLDKTIFDCD